MENEDSDLMNQDEVVEVIQLEGGDIEEDLADEVEDIELENEEDEENGAYGGGDIKDNSTFTFTKHTDSVFSVNIDPKSNNLVISGGQDDKAYVWSATNGEVLLNCTGHKDSVTCVGFSHDGVYAATADLSGLIKVWKVETKKEIWSFEVSDVEWLQWHPLAHVLIVGTVDGDTWMWKIPDGDCKTFQGHGCTAGVGRIMPDGKRLCVGYDDGSVKLWDMKSGGIIHNITGNDAHKSSIICLDCYNDNNIIITGSTDVTAKIINTNSGKVLSTFDCKDKNSQEENSVETVGFCKVQNLAATGTLLGSLCIWDVPTQTVRNVCHHETGIVKLKWDNTSPLVYTACLDGIVRLWDARNSELISSWSGHLDSILDFNISNDSNILVTASDDNTAKVFTLNSPER